MPVPASAGSARAVPRSKRPRMIAVEPVSRDVPASVLSGAGGMKPRRNESCNSVRSSTADRMAITREELRQRYLRGDFLGCRKRFLFQSPKRQSVACFDLCYHMRLLSRLCLGHGLRFSLGLLRRSLQLGIPRCGCVLRVAEQGQHRHHSPQRDNRGNRTTKGQWDNKTTKGQ